MATNKAYELGIQLTFVVGSGVKSGDPVVIGEVAGVALTDADANNKAPVDMLGVYNLSVKGVNDAGNHAIAVGDPIFFVTADTPRLSAKASGKLYGIAYGAVTSGATATIPVLLIFRGAAVGGVDFASLPGVVLFANAKAFVSTEQTGNGAPQNIAHGLGLVPAAVLIVPTSTTPATLGDYTATEGAHTNVNVIATVTNGKKYKVLAWA